MLWYHFYAVVIKQRLINEDIIRIYHLTTNKEYYNKTEKGGRQGLTLL